jgi:hypothetical protein
MEGGSTTVHEAINAVAGSIMDWSTNVIGDLEKRAKKKLKVDLEKCRRRNIFGDQVAREEILKYKL